MLRDGEAIATSRSAGLERGELIRMMVGRELSAVFPKRPVERRAESRWRSGSWVNRASGIRDVSFTIRRGEILGIAGLVGSGRTELAETIFGLRPADAGEILIDGQAVSISRPARAIELGIGYVPEDRRHHGVVLEMSVAANASLANLSAIARHGLIDTSMERSDAASYVQRLRIKASSVSTDVGTLSGGNQQKVALARWLAIKPRILILDEPTQGVDVGSKAEIHELMVSLAEQGLAVIMISSEMPEILGMSDRVAVMQAGSIRAILHVPPQRRTPSSALRWAMQLRATVAQLT